MEIATLLIAVAGLALGVASLAWQYATHLLTGGRVKVELLVGALSGIGGGMATIEPANFTPDQFDIMASQGFVHPVVVVRVRCIGRLPVSVTRWSLKAPSGISVTLPAARGPELAHRMAVGDEPAQWIVNMTEVHAFMEASKALDQPRVGMRPLFAPPRRHGVFAAVELGDGRTFTSTQELPI